LVGNDGTVVGIVAATAAILPFFEKTGSLPQNINWAIKAPYASLLFEAQKSLAPTKSRAEAIERVQQAVCAVYPGPPEDATAPKEAIAPKAVEVPKAAGTPEE
jgi:hypothetical protein